MSNYAPHHTSNFTQHPQRKQRGKRPANASTVSLYSVVTGKQVKSYDSILDCMRGEAPHISKTNMKTAKRQPFMRLGQHGEFYARLGQDTPSSIILPSVRPVKRSRQATNKITLQNDCSEAKHKNICDSSYNLAATPPRWAPSQSSYENDNLIVREGQY